MACELSGGIVGDQGFKAGKIFCQSHGCAFSLEVVEHDDFFFVVFSGIGQHLVMVFEQGAEGAAADGGVVFAQQDQLLVMIEDAVGVGQGFAGYLSGCGITCLPSGQSILF